jgi:hypothetical protein
MRSAASSPAGSENLARRIAHAFRGWATRGQRDTRRPPRNLRAITRGLRSPQPNSGTSAGSHKCGAKIIIRVSGVRVPPPASGREPNPKGCSAFPALRSTPRSTACRSVAVPGDRAGPPRPVRGVGRAPLLVADRRRAAGHWGPARPRIILAGRGHRGPRVARSEQESV